MLLKGIILILLSLLAVPSLILSKKPNAKELLDKVAPYQGWIGLVFCFWGVWGIIDAVLNIGWMTTFPIVWFTWLAGSLVEAILGFMLGYGVIAKYAFSKNEASKAKGDAILAKLAPMQGKLGVFGIIVGIWWIIAGFMWHAA